MAFENINAGLAPLFVEVAELSADPQNARIHDDENLNAIEMSFKAHGQQTPIVVDESGKVLAGNGRLEVARRLGWAHIAAITFSGEEATAFALADNRTGELAKWDQGVLESLLAELPEVELEHTGFSLDFVAKLPGFNNEQEFPDLPTGDAPAARQMSFYLSAEQHVIVTETLAKAKETIETDEGNSNSLALLALCEAWV